MKRIILAAKSGTGKTTYLLNKIKAGDFDANRLFGTLAPADFEKDSEGNLKKTTINLCFLPEFECYRYSVPKKNFRPHVPGAMDGNIGFDLDESVNDKANAYFKKLQSQNLGPKDIVIVDEIGPYELIKGKGIMEALKFLDMDECECTAIITSRLQLVDVYQKRWSDIEVHYL